MLQYFYSVNSDGITLKTPSYVFFGFLIFLILLLVSFKSSKSTNKRFNTRKLAFCSISIALAFALSYIKLFEAPMGGSITLMSSFFITFIGYLYGPYIGIMSGIAYGFLQLIAGPYVIHPMQLLMDYPFAFGALGLSGIFCNKKYGVISGYITGVLGRYIFAILSGVIFFASYAGDQNVWVYSILYNGGYLGIEALITLVILCIPPVRDGLKEIKKIATA